MRRSYEGLLTSEDGVFAVITDLLRGSPCSKRGGTVSRARCVRWHRFGSVRCARVGFLACPRKPTKRRTPRRLGPAGLIAGAISLANGQPPTGRFDATSCRGEPRAAGPAPLTLRVHRACGVPLARRSRFTHGGPPLRFPDREARHKGGSPFDPGSSSAPAVYMPSGSGGMNAW